MTLASVDLAPNVAVPQHQHENEQLGFVLKGSVTMVIGGDEKELRVGDAYSIASNVPHSARSGANGATVMDVFAPIRADWEKAERLQPSRGGWPD